MYEILWSSKMSTHLRVGLLQMNCEHPKEQNLAQAAELIGQAARAGAQIVCLPEQFALPWFPVEQDETKRAWAETEGGPIYQAMQSLAIRYQVGIIASLYERAGERLFSAAYLIGPDGTLVGKYRKNHIPNHPGWYEAYYYGGGDLGFPAWKFAGVKVGAQVCYDNAFPEGSRLLALAGCQVIFAPRATGAHTPPRWRTILGANAAANGCFVVTVNRTGPFGPDPLYCWGGDSAVYAPDGSVIAAAQHENEALVVDLDMAKIAEQQVEWPLLKVRRPEIYADLTKQAPA
jgi:N-carbamoylputrescine amidase